MMAKRTLRVLVLAAWTARAVVASAQDADSDGVSDEADTCPGFPDGADADLDGVPDHCDVCVGLNGADADGDGFPEGCDCDDAAASVHPGAGEVCDGRDGDCDGAPDRLGALVLEGSAVMQRIASGAAAGNGRALSATDLGRALSVAPFAGPSGDVYFRAPLALAPQRGEQSVRVQIDRDPAPGDHDFMVALSDGRRAFGVGLYDAGGSAGARYQALPFSAADLGDRLVATEGTGQELDEASPYTLDFVLGASPRIELTSATGATASLELSAGAVGVLNGTTLGLVLVGNEPHESYVVRRVEVSQLLDDADGDGVCDAIDRCAGLDDRGPDGDRDGVPDACDVCPGGDDTLDTDQDDVPDACDLCAGSDDRRDADGDAIPDACDVCPDDPANDFDADGVCDHADVCLSGRDDQDADEDGVPDACDPCPRDGMDDTDEDGTCDLVDLCAGDDRTGDNDGDGICADRDCDDTRASVRPGAEEICDGFDSNCDGVIPERELDSDGDLLIDCRAPKPGGGCAIRAGDARAGGLAPLLAFALAFVLHVRRAGLHR